MFREIMLGVVGATAVALIIAGVAFVAVLVLVDPASADGHPIRDPNPGTLQSGTLEIDVKALPKTRSEGIVETSLSRIKRFFVNAVPLPQGTGGTDGAVSVIMIDEARPTR